MTGNQKNGKDRQTLRQVESHFAFGENWASFARGIGDERIGAAVADFQRLVPVNELQGSRFMDIGCGSGLHSVAAIKSGVGELLAVDIDPDSVATSRAVLDMHAGGANYRVERASIFDIDPEAVGRFDVVYSWGVLHHTGDMLEALQRATRLVRPDGLLVFALYRKTPLCGFWKVEKRLYSAAPRWSQKLVQALYAAAYRVAFWPFVGPKAKFEAFLQSYRARGMEWYHDVHDWLGGYPYESASPEEVDRIMADLGFVPVRRFVHETKGRSVLFGSGCDEYVFRAASDHTEA